MIDLDSFIGTQSRFRWGDALYHPQWRAHLYPNNTQYKNIILLAPILARIEKEVGRPMVLINWLRCEAYNKLVGGAKNSFHVQGGAADVTFTTLNSGDVRLFLSGQLERLGVRMENLNTPHIHFDIKEPGVTGRFFIP